MSIRLIAGITLAAASVFVTPSASEAKTTTATKATAHHTTRSTGATKQKIASAASYHKWHHKTSGRRGAYMVPPPPAFMPCILPELYYHQSGTGVTEVAVAAVKKPENPYKKYIQTPAGDAPEPVQTRKGVVTWSNRS